MTINRNFIWNSVNESTGESLKKSLKECFSTLVRNSARNNLYDSVSKLSTHNGLLLVLISELRKIVTIKTMKLTIYIDYNNQQRNSVLKELSE